MFIKGQIFQVSSVRHCRETPCIYTSFKGVCQGDEDEESHVCPLHCGAAFSTLACLDHHRVLCLRWGLLRAAGVAA